MLHSFDSRHGTQYTLVFFGSFYLEDCDYFLVLAFLFIFRCKVCD